MPCDFSRAFLSAGLHNEVVTDGLHTFNLLRNFASSIFLGLVFDKPAELHGALEGRHIHLRSFDRRVLIEVGFDLGSDGLIINIPARTFPSLSDGTASSEDNWDRGQ